MALSDVEIGFLVDKYIRERDRFAKMATVVAGQLSAQLRAATIPHIPTFRAKEPDSLQKKLTEDRERHDFRLMNRELAPSVQDLAGVRTLLYRPADVSPTCDIVEDTFAVEAERNYDDAERYSARHRIVRLRTDIVAADVNLVNLVGVMCEVQVVTVSDHIFNELQHDITYKPPAGGATPHQLGTLRQLRSQLNAVRVSVDVLMEATDGQRLANLTTVDSPDDLRILLASITGRAIRGDYEALHKLLAESLPAPLTRARLELLPIDAAQLDAASARLDAAGIADYDDVGRVIYALWSAYGPEFLEVAGAWRSRSGKVARLLDRLHRAEQEVRSDHAPLG